MKWKKKGWVLVDPGSGAGLMAQCLKHVERGENWFGYYWSPTSMIGKYKMHKLDFGVPFGGKEIGIGCIVKAEKDCANPKTSLGLNQKLILLLLQILKKCKLL